MLQTLFVVGKCVGQWIFVIKKYALNEEYRESWKMQKKTQDPDGSNESLL